jgi:hypothetical protein
VALVGLAIGLGLVARLPGPGWRPGPAPAAAAQDARSPARPAAPALEDLDAAIARAEAFVDGLYKPLDAAGGSLAEYYAVPLRVYYPADDLWRLAGEAETAFCRGLTCYPTTAVTGGANFETSETFAVEFRSPRALRAPLLGVHIEWDYSASEYAVRVTNDRFEDAATAARVYLGDRYVATYGAGTVGEGTTLVLDKRDVRPLQSFRYTIRHGNQAGQNYYWYRQDLEKYHRLAGFQERWGFGLDYDLRGPIWGHGTAYPDDMMFDADGRDGTDAFRDCAIRSTRTPLAYPYRSKVCVAGPRAYAAVSRLDPLAPTIQALHALNKYGDPDRAFGGAGPGPARTPVAAAAGLEQTFGRLGFGLPMCTPVGCKATVASAVRTFQFGALETLLGYDYGREASAAHADAAAALALRAQIGDDGVARTASGDYYRPAQRGGFYLSWDAALRYRLDRPFPYRQLDARLNMPAEYAGVVVTNMETTLDGYAFLVLYRCKKYGAGCPAGGAKPSDRPAPPR